MAVDQYAGRGQQGTVWQSEPGKNLTFSLLLMPAFLDPKHQFRLTVAVSIALVRWLESLLPTPVAIKWPNDLYVGDRKIGGILIENILKGKYWKSAVVGIGLNVNQTEFPEAIRARTTSVKQILQTDSVLTEQMTDLCRYVERSYAELRAGEYDDQLTFYTQHLYRRGELHPFLIDGVRVNGILDGVTETGRLRVDFNGYVVDFDIKEIAFVF